MKIAKFIEEIIKELEKLDYYSTSVGYFNSLARFMKCLSNKEHEQFRVLLGELLYEEKLNIYHFNELMRIATTRRKVD